MEYLDTREDSAINHSHDAALMAINLPHAETCAKAAGLQLPPRTELQRLLPQSRRYAFLDRRTVHSRLLNKKVKCLVFKKRASK
ncbi:MAG: hypothetical protein Q4A06_09790 [Cardiobacteriaceae bacterium]|nr:hypothetical protein [Cardiobacteriaceae bacterium]